MLKELFSKVIKAIILFFISMLLTVPLLANSAKDTDFIYSEKALYIPVPQSYSNLTYLGFLITRYEPTSKDSNVNADYTQVVEIDGKKQWFVSYSKNGTISSTNTDFYTDSNFSAGTPYFKLDYDTYERQLFSYYGAVKNNKYKSPISYDFLKDNTKFKLVVNHIYRNQSGDDITVPNSTKEYYYQLSKAPVLTKSSEVQDTQVISHVAVSDKFVDPIDNTKQKDMTRFYSKFLLETENEFEEEFKIEYNVYDYKYYNTITEDLKDGATVLSNGVVESGIETSELPYTAELRIPLDHLDNNQHYCLEVKVTNDKFASSSLFYDFYTDYEKPTSILNVTGDSESNYDNFIYNANKSDMSTINATLNLKDNLSLNSVAYQLVANEKILQTNNQEFTFKTSQIPLTINMQAPFDEEGELKVKVNSIYDYGSNNNKDYLATGDRIFYDSLAPRILTRRTDDSLVTAAPAVTLQNLLKSADRYMLELVIEDNVAGIDLTKTGPKTNMSKTLVTSKPDGSAVGVYYKIDEMKSEYNTTIPTKVTYWIVGNINSMEYAIVDFTATDKVGNTTNMVLTAEIAIKPTSIYVSNSSILLVEGETEKITAKAIPYSAANGDLTFIFDDNIYAKINNTKQVAGDYTEIELLGLYRGNTTLTIASKSCPTIQYKVAVTVVPHALADLSFNSQLSYFDAELDNYKERSTTMCLPNVEPTKMYFNIRSWVDKELDVQIQCNGKVLYKDTLIAPNMIDEVLTLDYPQSTYDTLEIEVLLNGKYTKQEKYFVHFGDLPYEVIQTGSDISVTPQSITIPAEYPQVNFTGDILAGFVESAEDLYEFRTYTNGSNAFIKTPIGYLALNDNSVSSSLSAGLKANADTVVLPQQLPVSSKPYLALQGIGDTIDTIVSYRRDTVHSTNGVKLLNITEGDAFTPKVNITIGLENIMLDNLTSQEDWDKFEQAISEAMFKVTPKDGTETITVFHNKSDYPQNLLNESGIYQVTFECKFKETGDIKSDTITINFLRDSDRLLVDVDNSVKYSFNKNIIVDNTTRDNFVRHGIIVNDDTKLGIKGTYLKGLVLLYSNESSGNNLEVYDSAIKLLNAVSGVNVNCVELYEDVIYVGTDAGLFSLNEVDYSLSQVRTDRVTAMCVSGNDLLVAYGNTIESFKDSSNRVTVSKQITEMYSTGNNIIIVGEDRYVTSLYS